MIARSNINNFKYEDNMTLMAKNEKELKGLLISVKEVSKKADLKLSIKKKLRSRHLVSSLHGK